jgi:hypothetical protein
MSLTKLTAAVLLCAFILPTLPAEAATKVRVTRAATRIEVYPQERSLLDWHRRCTDWYALERRASGTVLTPQMRCWWTRR